MNNLFGRLTVNLRNLVNYGQLRFESNLYKKKLYRNLRPIMGWPRPHLAKLGKKYPEPHKYNWLPYLPKDGDYTIRPLPIYKLGGRDMETGQVVVRTLGGGNPKKFRWVDTVRKANDDGSVKEERVLQLKYDPLRTPKLALVADQERTRWILASEGVEVGDIICTYSEVPRNPVRAKNGDAHPLGALPVGTDVHHIEAEPGKGAKFCTVAGSSAKVTKRAIDGITIKLPHGDSYKVQRECMAVVGQMSNVGHGDVQLWCPQRKRWLGKRPRSGLRHKKDGYCGRKVHPDRYIDLTVAALEAKRLKQAEPDLFDLR